MSRDARQLPEPDRQLVDPGAALSPSDRFAVELRGFGPLGIAALLVILLSGSVTVGRVVVPVGALLVLLWTRWSRTPWREIGYLRPRSWIRSVAGGLAFGCVFKCLMKAIVMPLFGAPAVNPAYHYLSGNRAMLPAATLAMAVAGFGEETVFRGYLFERLGKLFGSRAGTRAFIVLISTALFGAAHYADQGLPGVEQAIITGLVFGTIFAFTRRIWMLMCAHAGFDLTALAMIYLNLESDVAHFIFK